MTFDLKSVFRAFFALLAVALLSPSALLACACGCGVFDVQTAAMMATHPGGTLFLELDSMDQNRNWSFASKAPASNNADKRIQTRFFTAGLQYMFNRRWGFMAELPYWSRRFDTTDASGGPAGFKHAAVGDVRLRGIYSGFSPDMSSGLTFGAKLPSGDDKYANFDRDTEIGSGSVDFLLGAYRMQAVTSDRRWIAFGSVQWDEPLVSVGGYRPGSELDAAVGAYFNDWGFGGLKVAPLVQLLGSWRGRDGGPAGHPDDSGYRRLLVGPGLELSAASWRVYGDVGLPVYQYAYGNQLTAPVFYKLSVGVGF